MYNLTNRMPHIFSSRIELSKSNPITFSEYMLLQPAKDAIRAQAITHWITSQNPPNVIAIIYLPLL